MKRAILAAGAALIFAGPAFAADEVVIEKRTTTTTTTKEVTTEPIQTSFQSITVSGRNR